MLFGNDKLFSVARSAKLGKTRLPPVLAQLQAWIQTELHVGVVHIVLDRIDIGPCVGRPRLTVILETDADYKSWKTDAVTIRPEVERRVVSQFTKLAEADSDTVDTGDVLLTLDNFSDECLGRACSAFLKSKAHRIVREFASARIWKIDGFSRLLVVFFETDKEIQVNTDNGTCAKISERCFDGVKRHDEFDYLSESSFRLKFDSKENVDKNFNGNLFYYWR